MRFGRLFVLGRQARESKVAYWRCRCDCGKTAVVRGSSLRSGHTKSCGCLHNELSSRRATEQNTSHGESKTRLYSIWFDMRKRCENEKHWAFKRYGGRGITVCEEWRAYEQFSAWAKNNGYAENLTIDRIDNSMEYSPANCRWVDRTTQARNRSSNVTYTHNGKTLTIPEWSELTGITPSTLYSRLTRYGWTVEKALTTPARRHKQYGS